MRYEVLLTQDAERDLEEMHDYVAEHDAPRRADLLLGRIGKVIESLASFPERGMHPRELLVLGIREFRQIYFKPYRVIYRVVPPRVYILLIVDGRRNMQTLLAQRLLGA
jgi:toxin ParE1/3/4